MQDFELTHPSNHQRLWCEQDSNPGTFKTSHYMRLIACNITIHALLCMLLHFYAYK